MRNVCACWPPPDQTRSAKLAGEIRERSGPKTARGFFGHPLAISTDKRSCRKCDSLTFSGASYAKRSVLSDNWTSSGLAESLKYGSVSQIHNTCLHRRHGSLPASDVQSAPGAVALEYQGARNSTKNLEQELQALKEMLSPCCVLNPT